MRPDKCDLTVERFGVYETASDEVKRLFWGG